jgi:hypothetical protein
LSAFSIIGVGAVVLAGCTVAIGLSTRRRAMGEAENAYAQVAGRQGPPLKRFDPAELAGLPEIAQRYFRHAITPGTPHYTIAELEMEGTFLLGDKEKFQTYEMSARQALSAPDQFVWIPRMRSGAMTISGSDALVRGEAWTRFWLLGLVPVAQVRTSPNLVRSAQFRAAVETAMWLPATLLPENGVEWEQLGPNEAVVTLRRFQPKIALRLKLNEVGRVTEVVGHRWSNANPAKVFRLQPFGGAMLAEGTFQGLTIPTEVCVGNHYGTEDYLPFFQARITKATYR